MRIILSVLGLILFLSSVAMGFYLLDDGALSGSEFVSLIVAFAIIGLIISFASEVQEFSVAGNIVKLKQVKRDAERSMSELESARTETFRFLLSLAERHAGGFAGDGPVDERIPDFWALYYQIEKFGCKEDLADDLLRVLETLAKGQINTIGYLSDQVLAEYRRVGSLPPPSELVSVALSEESIGQAATRGVCSGNADKVRGLVAEGLQEYRKIYDLYQHYRSKI
ncbi:hypothetical protein ACNSTU_13530 [Aquisalimonas sp. APHAB1-3]|uniref:hypothetical protein n=1 Tax=Aquisalimonas sp. APHAB1-3 TaxID=3402080 RepID=UPI003AAA4B76